MVSAPVNVYTASTRNRPAAVRVYLGPADGSRDSWTESFDLIPLEIFRVHGSRPDYAVFEYKHSEIVENVDATVTVTGEDSDISFNRQVRIQVLDVYDIYNPDLDGEPARKQIFWGELLTETLHIDPRTQRITIAARVADYHFGDPLEGEHRRDPVTGDGDSVYLVPVDPVFNPLIDGVIEPNALQSVLLSNFGEYAVWYDPESGRTADARILSGFGGAPELWTLSAAVETVSTLLLDAFEFINAPRGLHGISVVNPPASIWDDAPAVKNLRLQRGWHLNRVLDELLIPNGYGWFLSPGERQPVFSLTPVLEPEIVIFKRGEGTHRELKLQAAGETLDPSKSNTTHLKVTTDVGNLANEIRGWGSHEQRELTIPLLRGWIEDDDDLTTEDLRRSEPTSDYSLGNTEAWRLWVANEAGDYDGSRTTVQPITTHLDLTPYFDIAIPRRRIIEDCLTLDGEGVRRVPLLEWSGDNGSTWQEVPPEWGWVILGNQIGVYFTGDTPPEELVDAGSNATLRITCTITGDDRLYNFAHPQLDESPSLRFVPLWLDLSDRYHNRAVETTGDCASVLAGDSNGADEADDLDEMGTYLAELLKNEQSAELLCDVRLHGLQLQYEIGDLITVVDGRDIFLNRNKPDNSQTDWKNEVRYVQVMGIRYDVQEQSTELIVEPVDGFVDPENLPSKTTSPAMQSPALQNGFVEGGPMNFVVEGG